MYKLRFYMNIIMFILGGLTVILSNPLPHYIIKLPNLDDTYRDNNNKLYKYKLKFIS